MTTPDPHSPICSICGKPVILETSNVDEFLKPIHEGCYLNKVSSRRTTTAPHEDCNALLKFDCLGSRQGGGFKRIIPQMPDSFAALETVLECLKRMEATLAGMRKMRQYQGHGAGQGDAGQVDRRG
jgi:hypothetical protein